MRTPDGRTVVAIVATRCRTELLLARAIPSILGQSRLPDKLLIVVDHTAEELPDEELRGLKKSIRGLCREMVQLKVLRNRRTRQRAAGAWNTAIDLLHRDEKLVARPDLCYAAILDDDDAWEPDHLELNLDRAIAGDLSMVVGGLIRHEKVDDQGQRQTIPEKLNPKELFIRGQHVQGSNLFVRLDAMLEVGGFDERLPSCTDRDLCIRLLDLADFRFGCVRKHTVHHYADPRPDRLSAPASPAKLDGLTRFWGKYAHRFDEEARRLAADRAKKLFGWEPLAAQVVVTEILPPAVAPRCVGLVVGFVTDAAVPGHVVGLMDDLVDLAGRPDVVSLKVVVVENGPIAAAGERPLRRLTELYRSRGLDVDLIAVEQQRDDWEHGKLVDTQNLAKNRIPIAAARTVLNTYVARASAERPGAWAWILDDDKRLSARVDRGDGVLHERKSPDLAALCSLQDSGADAVIGPDTDAAPLPFTATIRMQLLDLLHNLRLLSSSRPHDLWSGNLLEDAATQRSLADYYYDLSRFTEHLETPITLTPGIGGTCAEVLQYIATRVDRLLAGEPVFRPLVIDARDLSTNSARESVQRGGSTIFFNPSVLLEYPQNLARFGNQYVRRSDMLVSQIMRDQLGLRIVMHTAAAVRHDRSHTRSSTLTDKTLREDVLGYALYRSENEIMKERPQEQRRKPLLEWTAAEIKESVRLVRKYIDERLAAVTLNGWRIVGLAKAIRKTAQNSIASSSAWSEEEFKAGLEKVVSEMDRICGNFKPNAVAAFAGDIRKSLSDADIRSAFSSMDALIIEYRATRTGRPDDVSVYAATRELRAQNFLERTCGVVGLQPLGTGGEGVVLTDGVHVYKVFDILKIRPNHDTYETLKQLHDKLVNPRRLYPLSRVEVLEETLIVVYPYEPSEPYYEPGKPFGDRRGAELIELLRECKASGIVFRNMHPKNLRVSKSGLKLVDYGSDIRPYSDPGYRSMAERAWLTWRWSHRMDLQDLMRKALEDKTLPELDGFEGFWSALCQVKPSASGIVSEIADKVVFDSGAKFVLDFGCGIQALSARKLATAGLRTVGYDPGRDMQASWERLSATPATLHLTTDRISALGMGPFDATLCSLVLCELGDGPEYEQALDDLRSSITDSGLVVITICNPFSTFGGATPLHTRRDLPKGVSYEDSFHYLEHAEADTARREVHRPLRRIERDLLKHGLRVEHRIESKTVDLVRFEPASDFLTLVCRPIAVEASRRRVSLVIKTCAMEALTIERQVEHLVGQLEGPAAFHERLLAIDSLPDGFVRQYAQADWAGLQLAARRLLERGLIDRIVLGPSAPEQVRRLNRDWFNIDSEATHTGRGAPLAMPMHAFEASTGNYILQVDSDLLIGRRDREFDYLSEMIRAIEASQTAITVSLNIAQASATPYTSGKGEEPWRVEVRGCLFHRARLLAARPFPNSVEGMKPQSSWHRAMDAAATAGRFTSLRGGSDKTYFVHPPNDLKESVGDWMLLLDLVEKGHVPMEQLGKVDLIGGPLDWVPRNRAEQFVFIITGRNVPPGRALRCIESLSTQLRGDWGAILVDDGSEVWSRHFLEMTLKPRKDKVTLLQPRERRGQLANMALAIRHICSNPESVILTLDLDDELIGPTVLDRVAAQYLQGADVTVGSMLRTDKHVEYPVSFTDPRHSRGGNVWQHLRTFRKGLFDAIPDHYLRLDKIYVDIAVDWSFMIPIAELATHPVWMRESLYLYEPSGLGKGVDREARERQIAAIVSKPSLKPTCRASGPALVRPETLAPGLWGVGGGILFLRHGERSSLAGLKPDEKDAVRLTNNGYEGALTLGKALGEHILLVSSPITRSVDTAEAIAEAVGKARTDVLKIDALLRFRLADTSRYEMVKRRLGWAGIMNAWTDGSLPQGILIPCHDAALAAIDGVLAVSGSLKGQRVVAITHDYMIIALLAALRGVRVTAVPYLAGVFLPSSEAQVFRGSANCGGEDRKEMQP